MTATDAHRIAARSELTCHCGLRLNLDPATYEADAVKGCITGEAVCDDSAGCGSRYTLHATFEPGEILRTEGVQIDEDLTGAGARAKRDNAITNERED